MSRSCSLSRIRSSVYGHCHAFCQAHVFCEPLMYFEPHPYFACRMPHPLFQAVFYTAQWSLLPIVIAMHFAKLTQFELNMQAHVFCEPHPYFACPLAHRTRSVLSLFAKGDLIKSSDVANLLGISTRQVRELLLKWSEQGWLEMAVIRF